MLGAVVAGEKSSLERACSGERPNPHELGSGTAGVQRRDTSPLEKAAIPGGFTAATA